MTLIDRVLSEPEFRATPPVLVDVGAAGGVHRLWRRIARHAVGVAFEPDAREAAPLSGAQRQFRRWIYCPCLAVPTAAPAGRAVLHLTHSPQCSSVLQPRHDALGDWAFADFFAVVEKREFAALPLQDALRAQGLDRIDWLKCDTQGTDLRLYLSLSEEWRRKLLAVEFEPGLIDAYDGEDHAADVIAAMRREPFWLAEMEVGRTPRGRAALIARQVGPGGTKWFRRLAPTAPGWVNLRYLRDPSNAADALDRRGLLLSWVFATITGQHGQALTVAAAGAASFGPAVFAELRASSIRRLRVAALGRLPQLCWRRLTTLC